MRVQKCNEDLGLVSIELTLRKNEKMIFGGSEV